METAEAEGTFSFNELSSRAKENAISKYAEPKYRWWDDTIYYYKAEGTAKGFEIYNVHWEGFSHQGSGASWTGRVGMEAWLRAKCAAAQGTDIVKYEALATLTEEEYIDTRAHITTRGRNRHEMTMECSWLATPDIDSDDASVLQTGVLAGASVSLLLTMYEAALNDIEKDVLEDARDYAREIYRALETEYEGYFEEESFAETALVNEWLFDEEGNMV